MPSTRDRVPFLLGTTLTATLAVASPFALPSVDRALAETQAATEPLGVSALGRIEPKDGVLHIGVASMVNAVNGSVVRKLLVSTGDRVEAGQVLVEMDPVTHQRAELVVREAELELAERQADMAEGEEQDVCARAEVAQRTADRRANLLRSGVTSDEEADVAAGDARALSGACRAARFATKAAVSAVDVARAKLASAEAEVERCIVRAPVNGRILRVVKHPGEQVGFDGVLELGRVDQMYAIAEVYETDIGRVHKGQKATVTSTALKEDLAGVVETIRLQVRKQDATGTDPAADKDARVVEVEVLLDRPEVVETLTNLQVEVLLHPDRP